MILRYILMADAAVPREAGKVDLIGAGVEAIFAPSVPAIHSAITVVVRLSLSPEEASRAHSVAVTLTAPDGKQVAGGEGEVAALPREQLAQIEEDAVIGAPLLFPLVSIVLPVYGRYQVAVTWDGEPVADPLPLTVGPAPEA
jgi:hypothetical protein